MLSGVFKVWKQPRLPERVGVYVLAWYVAGVFLVILPGVPRVDAVTEKRVADFQDQDAPL